MSFTSRKFRDIEEVQLYLNGAVICGRSLSAGLYGLVGETMTFTRPAFSVTFAAVPGRVDGLLLGKEIKTQIEAASVHIEVLLLGGRPVFIEKVPTQGVALDPALTETARTIFGLPATGTCEGRVIKQMLSAMPPRLENLLQTSDGTYHLLVWEGNN